MSTKWVEYCSFNNEESFNCDKPGKYLIAWQPSIRNEESNEINDVDAEWLGAGMAAGDIGPVFVISCENHRDEFVERFKANMYPSEATTDFIHVGLLASVTLRERERYIPEEEESFQINDDVELSDEPIEETVEEVIQNSGAMAKKSTGTVDHEAPYGRKADGTQRQRPGRKPMAMTEQ